MKNYFLYSLIYILIFFLTICCVISCGQGDDELTSPPIEEVPIDSVPIFLPGSMVYGSAIGKKASQEWKASGIAKLHNNDSSFWQIILGTENEQGFARELLHLAFIPSIGFFDIVLEENNKPVTATYSTLIDGGDVLQGFYHIDSEAENKIVITTLDTVENRISGNFTVTLLVESEYEDPLDPIDHPDRVTFSDVEFSVQILE